MTEVRPLPIRLPPLPGEALDSWLEALAHRMSTCLGDLLASAGMESYAPRTRHRTATALDWTVFLGPSEAAGIAAATGIPEPAIEAMTLARYDGTILQIDRDNRTVNRHYLWGRGSGSRYCPECLEESGGRWRLAWRLGWCFACPAHRRLLADVCPGCGRSQRRRPHPAEAIPQPGRCALRAPGRTGRAAPRCSAELTDAVAARFSEGHPVLIAQQYVQETILSGTARFGIYARHPQPATVALADVRALACRILTFATASDLAAVVPADLLAQYQQVSAAMQRPRSRPGFMAPRSAAVAAVGVTAALSILGAAEIPAAGAALRWLVERSRRRGVTVSPTAAGSWGAGTSAELAAVQLSALNPLLRPSERLRYRTATSRPTHPPPGTGTADQRARHTPALCWPELSLRFAVPGSHQQHLRAALSCMLVIVGTQARLSQAASQLGEATSAREASRILQLLAADPRWPAVFAGITQVADYLDARGAPIDYRRRRRLCFEDLLPGDAWPTLCRSAGTAPGTRKAAVARSVLFERISGLPAARAPFALDNDAFRADVASFPARLTPRLAAGLHDAGEVFLRRHGITDEPVTWHPPLSLLSGLELPGPDPLAVQVTEIHKVIRQGRMTLRATAEQLGTTIGAVRYLLGEHPAPGDQEAAGRVRADTRTALPQRELAELYLSQRLSLKEIGSRVGARPEAISRLAREYGIPLRKGRRPQVSIDRDWLYEQYVTRRRTLRELAREVGVSTTTMQRRADAHRIPLRPSGGPSHQQSLRASEEARTAPLILRAALQGVGGRQRLERFAGLTAHATLTAAAAAHGRDVAALSAQISRLERDLGRQLLIRARRGQPMVLTAFGAEVARAVQKAGF